MAAHSFSSPPGLTVTGVCRKRLESLPATRANAAAWVAEHAGPQASYRTFGARCGRRGKLDQAPERQPVINRLVFR